MIAVAIVGLFSGVFALVALGGLLFLLGLVLVAPALVRPFAAGLSALVARVYAREGTGELAQGNITRQPTRSAITASATMIGLAIVVGAGGMMWSMSGSIWDLFRQSMGSDFLLMPPSISIWKGNVGASAEPGQCHPLGSRRRNREHLALRPVGDPDQRPKGHRRDRALRSRHRPGHLPRGIGHGLSVRATRAPPMPRWIRGATSSSTGCSRRRPASPWDKASRSLLRKASWTTRSSPWPAMC